MYRFNPVSIKNMPYGDALFSNAYDTSSLTIVNNHALNYQKIMTDFKYQQSPKKYEVLELSIIGLGYVGAVSCACFASLGHNVIGVDTDLKKVEMISAGNAPIVEQDLDDLLIKGVSEGKITATSDLESAVLASNVTLISVGTPSRADGSCNIQYLKNATQQLAQALTKKDSYHVFIFRSTVPAKTTKEVLIPILEQFSNKVAGKDFGVCFNPEFLRESSAIDDFYHPPVTVIGALDSQSAEVAKKIYQGVDSEIVITSIEVAEFLKYINNTWHALKVSFGNEIGRICKAMDVDSHEVMDIFLQDTKLNISPSYLKPGFAFGGSCLPKDTRGIVNMAELHNVDIPIISHINQSNSCHIDHTYQMVVQLGVQRVAIVGLTFKPGTDDVRESPSIELMKRLLATGYQVEFYDPCILQETFLDQDPEVNARLNSCRCHSITQMIEDNQAIIIMQNKKYTEQIARMSSADKHIIDVVHLSSQSRQKANYHGICW